MCCLLGNEWTYAIPLNLANVGGTRVGDGNQLDQVCFLDRGGLRRREDGSQADIPVRAKPY